MLQLSSPKSNPGSSSPTSLPDLPDEPAGTSLSLAAHDCYIVKGTSQAAEQPREWQSNVNEIEEPDMMSDLRNYDVDEALPSSVDDPEVFFGPAMGTAAESYEDTLPLVSEPSVITITVHRGRIFDDLITFARKEPMDLKHNKYEVKVIRADGMEEPAEDNGGVLRDSLTEFWETFYMRYCIGKECKVPVIRHDMPSEMWKAFVNIIVLEWEQGGLFPVKIAPPFIQQCLFGDCGDLLKPYYAVCADNGPNNTAGCIERLPKMLKVCWR